MTLKIFGSNSEFAERKQLAADETRFCMESAEIKTQKDGKQRWYCTIYMPEGDTTVVKILTFDRSPSRDAGFQELNETPGALPVHNCWLEKREFKGKNSSMMQTFYQIRQDEKATTCPCADLHGEEAKDEEEPPDMGITPRF